MDYKRDETETRTYTNAEVLRALNIGTNGDTKLAVTNTGLVATTYKTSTTPHPVDGR